MPGRLFVAGSALGTCGSGSNDEFLAWQEAGIALQCNNNAALLSLRD